MPSIWTEKVDPKSGRTYYINRETKATQWTKPADYDGASGDAAAINPTPSPVPAAGGDKSGRSTAMSAASVTPTEASTGAATASSSSDWVTKLDPKTNRQYFYNTKTKATTWTAPEGVVVPIVVADAAKPAAAAAAKTAAALPSPWVEKTDPKSGRVFFYNPTTKATSWNRPEEQPAAATEDTTATTVAGETSHPAPTSTIPAPSATAPSDWVEKLDAKTNRVYYVNTKTKKTTWNKEDTLATADPVTEPAAAAAVAAASTPSSRATPGAGTSSTPAAPSTTPPALLAPWVEKTDPKSGRTYYLNPTTKETTWNRPTATPSSAAEAAPTSASVEWVEKKDPKTGRSYYFNKSSKETTWTKPEGFVSAPAAANAATSTTPNSATASGSSVLFPQFDLSISGSVVLFCGYPNHRDALRLDSRGGGANDGSMSWHWTQLPDCQSSFDFDASVSAVAMASLDGSVAVSDMPAVWPVMLMGTRRDLRTPVVVEVNVTPSMMVSSSSTAAIRSIAANS